MSLISYLTTTPNKYYLETTTNEYFTIIDAILIVKYAQDVW